MFVESLLLRIAEEEAEKFGGEVQWFLVDYPDCAGGVPVPHLIIDGWSYQIPPEACTNRERFRRWVQNRIKSQQNGCNPRSNDHCRTTSPHTTQLTFDL